MKIKIKVDPKYVYDFVWEGNDEFELVDEVEFTQQGKYQYGTSIYKQISSGKFFALEISRSGSYHSDWYYSFEDASELELYEVEKVEVVKHEWKAI